MAVYFMISVTMPVSKAGEKVRNVYDDYIARVRPIVESYGGVYIVRSEKIIPLGGEWKPDRVIIIRFPTMERLQACFASAEYKEIEDMRVTSVRTSAIVVEG